MTFSTVTDRLMCTLVKFTCLNGSLQVIILVWRALHVLENTNKVFSLLPCWSDTLSNAFTWVVTMRRPSTCTFKIHILTAPDYISVILCSVAMLLLFFLSPRPKTLFCSTQNKYFVDFSALFTRAPITYLTSCINSLSAFAAHLFKSFTILLPVSQTHLKHPRVVFEMQPL